MNGIPGQLPQAEGQVDDLLIVHRHIHLHVRQQGVPVFSVSEVLLEVEAGVFAAVPAEHQTALAPLHLQPLQFLPAEADQQTGQRLPGHQGGHPVDQRHALFLALLQQVGTDQALLRAAGGGKVYLPGQLPQA